MAKKAAAKQRPKAGAKAAIAARSKDAQPAPKKKTGFGKRSVPTGVARSVSDSKKSARPKSGSKPSKSMIGKAVGAVGSTISGIAESATSVFRRSPKAH